MADEEELVSGVSTAERHASPAAAASPPEKLPSYDAVRLALHDAAGGKKKPSSSKVALLLRALMYYKLDSDLVDIILQILDRYVASEKDDEKRRLLLPYIHYLLTELAPAEPRPISGVKDTLSKEVRTGIHLSRRVPALRSYGQWAENSAWYDAVGEGLQKLELEPEGKKKKESGGLFGLSKKEWSDAQERCELQYMLLSAARARPRRSLVPRAPLLEALKSDEPVANRHACALLLQHATDEPSALAPLLRNFMPHLRQKDAVVMPDELARVYWTRLCGALSHAPDMDAALSGEYNQAVVQSLADVSDRVFLEAVHVLRLSPKRLTDAALLVAGADGKDAKTSALREVHTRLAELLEKEKDSLSTPPVHGVCRAIAALAEAYIAVPEVAALTSLSLHPLYACLPLLTQVAQRGTAATRCAALKAVLWLPTRHAATFAELEPLLVAEFKRPAPLPPRLLSELFTELLRRHAATPWVHPFVLRLIHVLYLARPDLMAHVPLPELWRAVSGVSEAARATALAALWALLDVPPQPRHRVAIQALHVRIYAFLGAHAVALTSPHGTTTPQPGVSAALHALLVRLEAGVAHGPPDAAVVCLEALQGVALSHGSAVRLRVLEFLATCRRHVALLQPCVSQTLHVLDRLLAAHFSSSAPPADVAALLGPDVRIAA